MDQVSPESAVRMRAMDLLARREHSRYELQQKLANKFPEQQHLLVQILDVLKQENLQSDERFAEAFVVSRARRGQGPHRIRLELQQRGVDEALAQRAVTGSDTDWFELAVEVMMKKYGSTPCVDFFERAKRSKFLQYRGFNAEQIRACFVGK